jgi:hypothetical protein
MAHTIDRTATAQPAPVMADRFGPHTMQEIATALSLADIAAKQMLIAGGPFDQDGETGIDRTAEALAADIFGQTEGSQIDNYVTIEDYSTALFSAYLLGLSMGALSGALVPSMVASAKGGR